MMSTLPSRNKLCFGHWVAEGAAYLIWVSEYFPIKEVESTGLRGPHLYIKAVFPSEDLGYLHQSHLE